MYSRWIKRPTAFASMYSHPMNYLARWLSAVSCFLFAAEIVSAETGLPSGLPAGPLPAGLGVNIHFTHAKPEELKQLAETGITWIRMDFAWQGIERKTGVYDFTSYDRLMSELDSVHIRALLILDYGNPLYGPVSPATEEARSAFARFAVAAVKHFAGRGVIWEMWNEPNIGFWKPKPDVGDYAKLALATGKAIHAAQPKETFIGPGVSGVDTKFCEACFNAGCLDNWAAVSVHPYRQGGPESAVADFTKLHKVIGRYAPGKTIPIISSEWGYSTAWKNQNPQRQADYLAREWLTNQWQHIPLSIYYDWHDDGTSATDPEHHFGMVSYDYQPKPAYQAAETLIDQLRGFTFDSRIDTGSASDFVLRFLNGTDSRYAIWTTAKPGHTLKLPGLQGAFAVLSTTGDKLPAIKSVDGNLQIMATGSPSYLVPETTP
jgi:hypothetical protein